MIKRLAAAALIFTAVFSWNARGQVPGMFVPMLLGCSVVSGSQTFTTSGTFVVPCYNTLTASCYGASGGSGGVQLGSSGGTAATAGTASTFDVLTAGGGNLGTNALTAVSNGLGGSAGTASGGTTNNSGVAGGNGGASGNNPGGASAAPGSFAGGAAQANGNNGVSGTAPGGGASGGQNAAGAGGGSGGGAYSAKTYSLGALAVGASITVTVGTGGSAGLGSLQNGAAGQRGQCSMSWS